MPNWCEGTLKVRGRKEDVIRWLKENVIPHKRVVAVEGDISFYEYEQCEDYITITGTEKEDDEIYINVEKTAHINRTNRNFVNKGEYYGYELEDGRTYLVLDFQAAWDIDSEPYVDMSQKYNVDFRLYGFERGMQFNKEVIVESGKLVKDEVIVFDNYEWECIFPRMGG